MLDRSLFRESPDAVRRNLVRRGKAERLGEVERMIELDAAARALGARVDDLRRTSKQASAAIGAAVKAGQGAEDARARSREVGDRVKEAETELRRVEADREALELGFENMLLDEVPDGRSADDNVVLRTWGDPPAFGFEPLAHDALGERLGILDFARAAKVAGARFTFLVGAGARLEHALIAFMRALHAAAGDTELLPPVLVNPGALVGTGQLPKFAGDLFQVAGESGYYLVPTAEVPVTNFHADEILDGSRLPLRYFAFSPCFRSEAGSYGKDVRGYIRQHHFNKVEMVRVTMPEQARAELDLMTDRAEEILRRLGLAHRVVRLCAGDTGAGSAMTHDVEVWLPSQRAYREISSCSTCADYQARRARIRYRPSGAAKPAFCHTLNGSGLAVGRTLVAILEQCQQADGSVAIPEALRPHFGAERIQAP